MISLRWFAGIVFVLFALAALIYAFVLPALGQAGAKRDFTGVSGDAERGAYVLRAAGCVGCHTDAATGGALLAGGAALKTSFGNFYAPNITPDATYGIGGWSLSAFSRALTEGLSPDGEHYFPAFPFTSYTKMTAQDVADLKVYLDSLMPVPRQNREHDLTWPFSDRRFLGLWKLINFQAGEFRPDPERSAAWNRGAYLVQGPGHCAECHTQRNLIGGLSGPALAGNRQGPDGTTVPAIDALYHHPEQPWTPEDLIFALQTGLMPDGDTFDGSMGEVVEQGTSYLDDADITAIANYLLSGDGEK